MYLHTRRLHIAGAFKQLSIAHNFKSKGRFFFKKMSISALSPPSLFLLAFSAAAVSAASLLLLAFSAAVAAAVWMCSHSWSYTGVYVPCSLRCGSAAQLRLHPLHLSGQAYLACLMLSSSVKYLEQNKKIKCLNVLHTRARSRWCWIFSGQPQEWLLSWFSYPCPPPSPEQAAVLALWLRGWLQLHMRWRSSSVWSALQMLPEQWLFTPVKSTG